ncbi:MAG: hypothetical protein ABW328_13825 [Ilumatobacteraceae bacterium]
MQERGIGLIMMTSSYFGAMGAMGALAAGGYSAPKFAIEGPGGYLLVPVMALAAERLHVWFGATQWASSSYLGMLVTQSM